MTEVVPSSAEPDEGAPVPGDRLVDVPAVLAVVALMLYLVAVLRFAWISDDAFIAFRAVANLVHGHGFVSNPPERVQGFTAPLWALLLAAGYSGLRSIYWLCTLLSLGCSLGLGLLLLSRKGGAWQALIALTLFLACKSFVTFSTSGLENTLAHLLVVAFVLSELRETPWRPWWPWLVAGLLCLNRLDHLILVLPALVARAVRVGPKLAWRPALLGFAPLFAWLLFAVVYFGFAWPNTAYAKLNLAIPRRELLFQGLSYLVDAVLRDGLLAAVVLAAFVLWYVARRQLRAGLPLLFGVALYLAYVVWIGGDFMGGRFLTAPFAVSVVLVAEALVRLPLPKPVLAATVGAALLFGRWALEPVPVDPRTECMIPPTGIVDERACYVEHTGIAQNFRAKRYEAHPYFVTGKELRAGAERVVPSTIVGLSGFAAGSGHHLVDEFALTDPLLSRIRFQPEGEWRIGHFRRAIPQGYLESLRTGQNLLADPCLRGLYADVTRVTRGPIWTGERFRAIWRLNLVREACPAPR